MMRRTNLALILATLGVLGCAALQPERDTDLNAALRLDRGLDALQAGAYAEAFDELTWVYVQCGGHIRGSQALAALAALELDPRNPQARPAVGAEMLARSMRDPGAPAWVRPLYESSYLLARSLGAPEPRLTGPLPTDTAAAMAAEAVDTAAAADPAEAPVDTAEAAEAPEAEEPAEQVEAAQLLATPDGGTGPAYGCGGRVGEGDRLVTELPTLPGAPMAALLRETEVARDSAAVRNARLAAELAELRVRLAETEQELERIRRTLRP